MNSINRNASERIEIKHSKVYTTLKRFIDIIVSIISIIILIPIFILISISIKIDSKGPIIYKQNRVGKNDKIFTMYKFRSMRIDAPVKSALDFTDEDNDSYVTKLGYFLRKTSLDECPQLINVLKGEMSLIGPRPVIESETDLLEFRRESGANTLTPGLTGWAQINGRAEISNLEKARYDKEYYEKMSFKFDVIIVLKTFKHLMSSGQI